MLPRALVSVNSDPNRSDACAPKILHAALFDFETGAKVELNSVRIIAVNVQRDASGIVQLHSAQSLAKQCRAQPDPCECWIDAEHIEFSLGKVAFAHRLHPGEPGQVSCGIWRECISQAKILGIEPWFLNERIEISARDGALLWVTCKGACVYADPIVCLRAVRRLEREHFKVFR